MRGQLSERQRDTYLSLVAENSHVGGTVGQSSHQ